MADPDDETENQDAAEAPAAEEPCMPCRGNGKVISNKGGSAAEVECPWCKGTGVRIPGHDAQAHWGGGEPPDAAA
jgi:DnaJ-class molecular chaperone